jgi:hypothetical protein
MTVCFLCSFFKLIMLSNILREKNTFFYETVLTAVHKSYFSIRKSFYISITSTVTVWIYFMGNFLLKYVRIPTQSKENDSLARERIKGGGNEQTVFDVEVFAHIVTSFILFNLLGTSGRVFKCNVLLRSVRRCLIQKVSKELT